MELSGEALAGLALLRTEGGRSVPQLGGEREPFKQFRELARNNMGRFAKRSADVELYRYFTPYMRQWATQSWRMPAPHEKRVRVDSQAASEHVPILGGYTIYVHNGHCAADDGKSFVEQPNGVAYGSLTEAAKRYPEIVARHYGRLSGRVDDDLVRSNALQSEEGLFIYIPRGVRVEQPIQVVFTLDAMYAQRLDFRNLIVVEELGDACIAYCDAALSPHPYFTQLVTECAVEVSGRLDFLMLQNQHDAAMLVHHVFVEQLADSYFHGNAFTVSGGAVRNNFYLTLEGRNAELQCNGLALVGKKQYVDMHTMVTHAAAQCESSQLYKTIVGGEGEANFFGIIDVQRDAQQTAAYQRNSNILSSETAKVHTRPQLIIHADDVKCSHGATVGRFDDEARFYMQQRGIAPEEVNRLLMLGFVDDVIGMVREETLRGHLFEMVERRLRGEMANGQPAVACGKREEK